MEPRLAMKVHRNHFADGGNMDTRADLSGFSTTRVGYTVSDEKPRNTALWAAQRQHVYRFAIVNAIFNEVCLAGDDLSVLEENDVQD